MSDKVKTPDASIFGKRVSFAAIIALLLGASIVQQSGIETVDIGELGFETLKFVNVFLLFMVFASLIELACETLINIFFEQKDMSIRQRKRINAKNVAAPNVVDPKTVTNADQASLAKASNLELGQLEQVQSDLTLKKLSTSKFICLMFGLCISASGFHFFSLVAEAFNTSFPTDPNSKNSAEGFFVAFDIFATAFVLASGAERMHPILKDILGKKKEIGTV